MNYSFARHFSLERYGPKYFIHYDNMAHKVFLFSISIQKFVWKHSLCIGYEEGVGQKSGPCTATFNDLLCLMHRIALLVLDQPFINFYYPEFHAVEKK
jgi:hypothetical protein